MFMCYEINICFLEPSDFESMVAEAQAWKKFINDKAGPSYRKPDGFPIPNSNRLVGNVYWGESLIVVTCDFPGLNTPAYKDKIEFDMPKSMDEENRKDKLYYILFKERFELSRTYQRKKN